MTRGAGPAGLLVACPLVAALLVAGCSAGAADPPAARPGTSARTAATSGSGSADAGPGTVGPATPALPSPPPVADPVSLPALMARDYDGRALRTRQVLARTDDYARYAVRFRSGRLRISGVMNVPRGKGPFPVLVLLHGYIDPAVYVTGQGLLREQDYLARHGYVALHVDYRGHAGSDPAPGAETSLRLGYTVDAINAVHAVRRSSLPYLDGARVGLLGRSMGGGVVFNVLTAQPGLVDAAVAFAPVSSDTVDNFERWTAAERPDVARRIVARHGAPADDPEFWRGVSPRTYFDRVTEPLLVHHGTSDSTCPPRWSRATVRALRAAGGDVRLRWYEGEEHAFGPLWPLSMRRTVAFFDRTLRA
jgi:dipeptidyl aminopeptidase/acylaminoacyl peptidase